MLDHAFGTLGLHRIGLSVFEFNERAIRSYLSCGFVVEGRAREAIWRDGRWWDEITMSVLDSEWPRCRSRRGRGGRAGGRRAAVDRHGCRRRAASADADELDRARAPRRRGRPSGS